MTDPNEIGKAKITVEADISGLSDSVKEAKEQVEGIGDAADGAGGRLDSSFNKMGETLERSTAGVRKFVGALGSIAGVATGLVGVFGLVSGAVLGLKAVLDKLTGGDSGDDKAPLPKAVDLLESLADKARGADKALAESPGYVALTSQIAELEEKLQSLRASLDGISAAGSAGIGAGAGVFEQQRATLERIEETESALARKREQQAELLKTISRTEDERADAAAKQGDAAEKQAAALNVIKELGEGVAISLLPDDEQIEENARRQIEQVRKVAEDAGVDLEQFYVRAAITAIQEKRDRELNLLDELHQKEMRNIEEQRQAKVAAAQAQADAYAERLRDNLESLTSAEFITTLESIPKALREVSSGVRRLK